MEWDYDRERAEAAMARTKQWHEVTWREMFGLGVGQRLLEGADGEIIGITGLGPKEDFAIQYVEGRIEMLLDRNECERLLEFRRGNGALRGYFVSLDRGKLDIGIIPSPDAYARNEVNIFMEVFTEDPSPRPRAPQLALTPIAPAAVSRGDVIFNERTKMLSKVVDVLDGHFEVIDEDEYESYWLAADQRAVSWAYRLEVDE